MASKIIVDLLLPDAVGGVAKWGEDLKRAMEKKVFYFRIFRGKKEVLKYIFLDRKGDIIHTTVPLPFKLSRPLLLTIHGLFKEERNIWAKFYPRTIKMADKITTPTSWLKRELGLKNAWVIPNGIFLEDFYFSRMKQRQDLKNKKKINILTITNFNFYEKCRGIEIIYKALNELCCLDKKIVFYILGEGHFRKEFEGGLKSKNNLEVIFCGFKDPRLFYQKADIFVYYSFLDIFPLVLIEAMASGLPVLTNEFGSANEIITNNKDGLIVKNNQELQKAIKEIVNNPVLVGKLIINAKSKVKEKFTWGKISNYWRKLYLSFLSQ